MEDFNLVDRSEKNDINVSKKETEKLNTTVKDFDDVLDLIGSVGPYQRLLLYAVLSPISVFEVIFGTNLWFLMDEASHWCNVPGREEQGLDLEAWRNLTIPRDENGEYSKCEMFTSNHTQIKCTSGWEYDLNSTNYESIVAEFNWVCDKSQYSTWVLTATNTVEHSEGSIEIILSVCPFAPLIENHWANFFEFVTNLLRWGYKDKLYSFWTPYIGQRMRSGRAVGTLILGYLADRIGRKPVFIITLVLFSFGRGISLFFADNVTVFAGICFVTGMSSPMFAMSSMTIGVELSGREYRAWINSFTWTILVLGLILLPGIAILVPNWFIFGWTTILIGSVSYLLLPWLPESPRWLLSKGRVEEVTQIMENVAKYNGTSSSFSKTEIRDMLEKVSSHQEAKEEAGLKGLLTILSRKRLALRTFFLTFTWTMNSLIFHGLNLNSLNLDGHRYMNFLLVMVMEVPGSLFGGILADKFGRRWSQVTFLGISGVLSVTATVFTYGSGVYFEKTTATVVVIICANLAKLFCTMSFLILYLQTMELYPTLYRTTGSGFASTVASIATIVVPFLVYTGKSSASTPWIITSLLCFLGMITASTIPETINSKLPETLEESENYGKSRKFWSFKLPKKDEQ